MVILTIDLGTTVTKVDLWNEQGRLGAGRAELVSSHPAPGRAEQDPSTWWAALRTACAEARAFAPEAWPSVSAIGFTAARQTLVVAGADGTARGPAVVWSDRRATDQADQLVRRLGSGALHQRTGQHLRATSVAAKLAWMDEHEPDRLAGARWVLSPRDWMAWGLTGQVVTDPTLASATGCYDRAVLDGAGGVQVAEPISELVGSHGSLFPPVVPSSQVVGGLARTAAAELALAEDILVVAGAGDRPSEVLGVDATRAEPMLSWGTAANLSQPGWAAEDRIPAGLVATAAATADGDGHWQMEGGLSAAGSLLAWVADRTGHPVAELVEQARGVEAGAGGVTVLPWLDGARAPWWRDDAQLTIDGLDSDTSPAALTRAVLEGVAVEVDRVRRSIESGQHGQDDHGGIAGLRLTGSGAQSPAWIEIVAAVTGLPVTVRAHGRAAAVGAALLTAGALGRSWDVDALDPVTRHHRPDPALVERYRDLRPAADQLAAAALDP